jgi:hypothetical protein
LGAPPAPSKITGTRNYLVELTDDNKSRLSRAGRVSRAVLAVVFPHPLRFKEQWHMARADKYLYAWRPIPPEGYIALGMVCTGSPEPPDVTSLRCVPEKWCAPTTTKPTKVWDDTGAGGGKPGSIWRINNMDMICVVAGHDAPTKDGPFYDLKSHRFFVDQFARTEAGAVMFM